MDPLVDPLKYSGLSEQEIRYYRYLLALQTLSIYENRPQEIMTVDAIRTFNRTVTASTCTVCERWYLSEVMYCPHCHFPLKEVKRAELEKIIAAWEDFRKHYVETTHIKLTRALAIKLYYLAKHGDQR